MRSITMNRRRKMRCTVVCALIFILHAWAPIFAQEDMVDMSASGLLTKATQLLSSELYGSAVPYLTEYMERMKDPDDKRVKALLQDVRFKLGRIMIAMEDIGSAVSYLKDYTVHQPLYRRREAMKLLAIGLYETGEYDQCISTVTNAFIDPPKVEEKEKKEVLGDDLSTKEKGGLTERQRKRYEKYAEEADETLFDFSFDSGEPDEEPEYSLEDRVLLNMTMAQSCTELGEWEMSIEPYEFVIEHASAEDRKGYAIMQLVTSLIELERFEEVRTLVTALYLTNARYDVRVNMALMTAAGALARVEEYDSALTLYRMVLPRRDLLAYQVGKMNMIRTEEGMPDVEIVSVTNEMGRVQTLFGNKKSGLISEKIVVAEGQAPDLREKPPALLELEESARVLLALPAYEEEVRYRTGQLYAKAGRPWEAVILLDSVYDRDPEGERGQQAFYETLQVLVDPLEEYVRVEKEAIQFLNRYTEGAAPRQVAYILTAAYQKQNKMPEVKTLVPYLEGFDVSEDHDILQYDCELWYLQAIADLMMLKYEPAREGFAKVLRDYEGFRQMDNATYWHAMCQLFLQKYDEAYAEFEAYLSEYSHGNWLAAAEFRCGLCLFGLEKYPEAQVRFTKVIDTYPESIVYSDACSMRADLLASEGMLDEAQLDYEEAIKTAKHARQDAYAVFQMTSMFELEDRNDEIIQVVNAYLDRRGEEADVAKAAYWIGKTKLAQGLVDEAVQAYRETIVTYGGDIQQDGVDMIISELVTVAGRLDEETLEALQKSLRSSSDETDSGTLKLRLRVLLAKMDGSELELGKTLIAELDDLTQAPPPVLSVICNASFEAGDYSRAEEILTLFLTQFEDSDFIRAAYKLRAFDLYGTEKYDEAMAIVKEVQALYGTDSDAAWAQLMKGRIELQADQFDVAHKTFRAILDVREWRGTPYAQATYYIGEAEEKFGNSLGDVEEKSDHLRNAFAWYQRAYFQYKGHARGHWAAEAYLASARCLIELDRQNDELDLENDVRNTFRAMLFDKYVNQLPQADDARTALGAEEVIEINTLLAQGVQTNLTVTLETPQEAAEADEADGADEAETADGAEVTE